MATVSRTWVFAVDTEGLADVGDSANIPVNWDSSPQELEFGPTAGGSNDSERARGPVTAGKDWTVLFPGLPAGSTVTDIQCTAYNYQRFNSNSLTSWQVRIRVVDSAGVSVHSAGDLGDTTIAGTGTDGAKVAGTVLASRAVNAGKQAAASIVALEVQVTRVGGGASNDFDVDDIAITIIYVVGGGTFVARAHPPLRPGRFGPGRPHGRFHRKPTPAPSTAQTILQSLGGAISPSGTLSNLVAKALAGVSSPTGLLGKLVQKLAGGATSPAGTLAKQAQKPLAGSSSPSGLLSKQPQKRAGGTTAPSGALSKAAAKSAGGATSPTGLLAKLVLKPLSGSASPSGALSALKVALLALGGSISPTGKLAKLSGKLLGGSTSPSGAAAKQVAKSAAGGINPSGALSKLVGKRLAGAISASGSLLTELLGSFVNIFRFGPPRPSGRSSSRPSEGQFENDPSGSSSSEPSEGRFDAPGPHDTP